MAERSLCPPVAAERAAGLRMVPEVTTQLVPSVRLQLHAAGEPVSWCGMNPDFLGHLRGVRDREEAQKSNSYDSRGEE